MKLLIPLCLAAAGACLFTACEDRGTKARNDVLEKQADAMEAQADATRANAEAQATVEKQAGEAAADSLERQAEATREVKQ